MKKIAVLVLAFTVITAFVPKNKEEKKITVCHYDPTKQFADLANDSKFIALHEKPVPFHFLNKAGGKMITFKTPDGKTASGFEIKTHKKSDKWLLVYQEWWGLNDHIKQEAEKYFNDLKDVNVLALDMYDGKVATEPQTAGKYMQEATTERLDAITKGGISYIGSKAKIGSIGWCFGGGRSLQSALIEGKQAVACVIFYGMPEKNVEKLKTLNTDVLGIFAEKDKYITLDIAKEFAKNMEDAGKKITLKTYDAEHGFANPSNPIYNKTAADDSYSISLAYLKERLK